MRADIHDGPEQKLQSEAGYIDARPQTDSSTKTSCNARPDHTFGSNRVTLVVGRPFPVYLDQRTFFGRRSVRQWGRADARAGEEGSDGRATPTFWAGGDRLGEVSTFRLRNL